MARLPLITQRRDIDVRVVYGQSIFELFQQTQNLLQREAPELLNFFAEPIVNAVRGEIAWNTRAVGVPRCADSLSSEEWAQTSQLFSQKIESVRQVIGRLEKAKSGNSIGMEALRGMLLTPNLRESLFLVGKDLVLTQWGCYRFGTDARSSDLFEQIERQHKIVPSLPLDSESGTHRETPLTPPERPIPPAAEAPSPPLEADIVSPPSRIQEQPKTVGIVNEGPVGAVHRSRFWRWLLLFLLLLLLVIGILWKSIRGTYGSSESALRAEVAELREKVDKKARECGLLPTTSGNSTAAIQPSVSNEEFRERQNESNIQPGSKVNVSLAWNDPADLDLYVEQPDGQIVYFKPCTTMSCGRLDVDANRCDLRFPCTDLKERPLENISWPDKMSKGKYVILVGLYSTNRPTTETHPVAFTVQVTKDEKPITYQGIFRREEISCKESCSVDPRRIAEFNIE